MSVRTALGYSLALNRKQFVIEISCLNKPIFIFMYGLVTHSKGLIPANPIFGSLAYFWHTLKLDCFCLSVNSNFSKNKNPHPFKGEDFA